MSLQGTVDRVVKAFDTLIVPVSVEVGLDGADDCITVTSYSSFKRRAAQCRTRHYLHFGLARFSHLP